MAGVSKVLVWEIRTKLEDLQLYGVLKPVVSVVNFIWIHVLHHRQFQVFLEVIDSELCDFPYRTAVKWLSFCKVKFRFTNSG